MLTDTRKKVSAKPLVAISDSVIPFFVGQLPRLFYRGRLGFPWTRAQRLLKTKMSPPVAGRFGSDRPRHGSLPPIGARPMQWKWSSTRWFAGQAGAITMDDVRLPMNPSTWL